MKYNSIKLLGSTPVILASKSPRRSDILNYMGFRSFDILASDADETVADGTPVSSAVEELAVRKLMASVEASGRRPGILYIAADTIVECDGVALGKPSDEEDAFRMIKSLSNRAHRVYTGEAVCINGRVLSGVDFTEVTMREITDEEAREYVATGEPMDKAGAYAIQGEAVKFVSGIMGDIDTVIGLSSALLDSLICRLIDPAASDIARFAELLRVRYPDAECALRYEGEPWRLLILAILSAQCTDEKVNRTAPELFGRFPTPHALADADIGEVEAILRPLGLFRNKAKNIIATAQLLCEDYDCVLPCKMEDLLRFPGVGRKVANLIRGDIFGLGGIVADTHCMRICGRIGAYPEGMGDPIATERIISPLIPRNEQSDFCHRVVLFGREVCSARNPDCAGCEMGAEGICAHARGGAFDG